MRNNLMDSNAPPQSRGTPFHRRNERIYNCVKEEKLKDQGCWRFARGKPVVAANIYVTGVFFRSTGRNGPPEKFEKIFGIRAWLVEKGRGQPHAAIGKPRVVSNEKPVTRGKPPEAIGRNPNAFRSTNFSPGRRGSPVTCRGEGVSIPVNRKLGITFLLYCARAKQPDARDRGHPPETGYDVLHRAKQAGMGELCTTDLSACDLSAFAEPDNIEKDKIPDNVEVKRGSDYEVSDKVTKVINSPNNDELKIKHQL